MAKISKLKKKKKIAKTRYGVSEGERLILKMHVRKFCFSSRSDKFDFALVRLCSIIGGFFEVENKTRSVAQE